MTILGATSREFIRLESEKESHFSDPAFGIAKFMKPDSCNWTVCASTYGFVIVAPPVLDEMLDPRLPTPLRNIQDRLLSIMEVAFSCLDGNPESRPTMETVSQLRIS
ncbi:hypothetical protein WN943_015866 [Citrus x changshan-huyou]